MLKKRLFNMMDFRVVIAIVVMTAMILIPAFISLRNRYILRASATDVLFLVRKAQEEAVKKHAGVAMVVDSKTGTCSIFVDNSDHDKYPDNGNKHFQNGGLKTAWKSSIRAHSGDIFKNDRRYSLPIDITVGSAFYPGIEFNGRGLPSNIPAPQNPGAPPAYSLSCSAPDSMAGKSFVAIDIISKNVSNIRYQVLINTMTGGARLVVSMDGGGCFQGV